MIIKNLTENENIILSSLKEKKEEADLVLYAKSFLDTDALSVTDEKVKKSSEIKRLIAEKKIKVLEVVEENKEELQKLSDQTKDNNKKEILDRISMTSALSDLEDLINYNEDGDIVRAAQKRMQELTGDTNTDNPELKDTIKNPIM
ncbi:MAG: hypothetical protein PHS93_08240 [Candidatus Omnitrophica bacterium]|nr:hypothetical protein [Candidatus Omnitrophota bacterium]MDD5589121.1 hypothetical protein [Candidatus Nanoarchaeia archaeon]